MTPVAHDQARAYFILTEVERRQRSVSMLRGHMAGKSLGYTSAFFLVIFPCAMLAVFAMANVPGDFDNTVLISLAAAMLVTTILSLALELARIGKKVDALAQFMESSGIISTYLADPPREYAPAKASHAESDVDSDRTDTPSTPDPTR